VVLQVTPHYLVEATAMSSLPTLPKELLLEILSYLLPADINALAQTCNYDITPTCLPFLNSFIA
jgi:hypothetical protein